MTRFLGTVEQVAIAWDLDKRLQRVEAIGRAYDECLACHVEVSFRSKVQAGAASTSERRIILNAQLLIPGRETGRNATFLHECAHIIADLRYRRNCRHDWRWRRVMSLLGENPDVCHKLDYISPRAHAVETWVCESCGEEYHFVRPPRRRIEECYCRPCGWNRGRLRVAQGPPADGFAGADQRSA